MENFLCMFAGAFLGNLFANWFDDKFKKNRAVISTGICVFLDKKNKSYFND